MRLRGYLAAGALFVVALASFYRLADQSLFSVFLARDLARARLWLAGQPFMPGPELTGGGYLPGPFFYLLLAPLAAAYDLFSLTWRSIPFYVSVFMAASIALSWLRAKRRWGAPTALLAVAMLVTSDNLARMTVRAFNPSFLPLFHLAAIFGLLEVFCFEEDALRRRRAWLIVCALLGLTLQLHLSTLTLVAGAVGLQILARRLGSTPLPGRELALGAIAFAIPSLPYLAWALLRPGGGAEAPFPAQSISGGVGLLLSPLKADWSAFFSEDFPRKVTQIFVLDSPLGGLCAIALPWLLASKKLRSAPGPRWRRSAQILALLFAVSFALTFTVSYLGTIRGRYLVTTHLLLNLLLAVTAAPLALAALRALAGGRLAERAPILAAAPLLLLIGIWGATDHEVSIQGIEGTRASDLANALGHIRERTGWDYDELRRRLVSMDLGMHVDHSILYQDLVRSEARAGRRAPLPPQSPDGYFLFTSRPQFDDYSPRHWRMWLQARPVAPEIAEALTSPALMLGAPLDFGSLKLLPYRVHAPEVLPRHLGNLGYAYQSVPDGELLAGHGRTGVSELAPDRVLFRWNPCHRAECVIALVAEIRDGTLIARLIGAPLSELNGVYRPEWTQELRGVFVELGCGPRKERRSVARLAGLPTFSEDYLEATPTLLAPLTREFALPCEPDRIDAGFEGARVFSMGKVSALPGSTLTWTRPPRVRDRAGSP